MVQTTSDAWSLHVRDVAVLSFPGSPALQPAVYAGFCDTAEHRSGS